MTPATGTPAQRLPAATPWALVSCAYAGVATLWLPLTVIQLLDGLLFVDPLPRVASDLALLWVLGLIPALVVAALGTATLVATRRLGAGPQAATTSAWAIALLPLVWVCTWQAARTGWMWLKAVAGFEYPVTAGLRVAAVSLLLAGLVLAWRRWGLVRCVKGLLDALGALRTPALLLLVAAAVLAWGRDPLWLRHVDTPVARGVGVAPPDVYLISLDTVAEVDAQTCDEPTRMPRLHAFAQGATCFTHFYASSNFTTPTASTMETGLLPWAHFATQPDATIVERLRRHNLAQVLVGQDYRVHAITDNLLASPRHRGTAASYHSTDFAHTTLFGNLFREAMTVFAPSQLPKLVAAALSFLGAFDTHLHGAQSPYDSRRTYQAALGLLNEEQDHRPLFLWAHSLPPHSPYLPPPSTKYTLLPPGELERWQDLLPDNIDYAPALQPLVDKHRLRYRESIAAADIWLGDFLDELDRQGRLDNALVIITSDHGESFEKGYYGHAGLPLHDALVRVPFIVKLPGQRQARVIEQPVSQADLAPTVLDLVGAPALPLAEGRSLRALLNGEALPPVPVFSMSLEHQSRFAPLRGGRFAAIDGTYKLVWDRDAQWKRLFDLRQDPTETTDLAAALPDTVTRMSALIEGRLALAEALRQSGLPGTDAKSPR